MNFWTKENGEWFICGPDLKDHTEVTVTKKGGVTDKVKIGVVQPNTISRNGKTLKYARPITTATKTCWECGCTFTKADARAYDGDWSDSYCGC